MKKVISIAIMLAVMLSFAACDKTAQSSTPAGSSDATVSGEAQIFNSDKLEWVVKPSLPYTLVNGEFSDGYVVVSNNELGGAERFAYMDGEGKLLGDGFVYFDADAFANGRAIVTLDGVKKTQIDKTGKITDYEHCVTLYDNTGTQSGKDEDGKKVYFNGDTHIVTKEYKDYYVSCVIDKNGKTLIPFEYSENYYTYEALPGGNFIKNSRSGKSQIVDPAGKQLFPPKDYKGDIDYILLSDSLCVYITKAETGEDRQMGFVDFEGNMLTENDYIFPAAQVNFENDMTYVLYADKSKGGAFIDKNGKEVLRIDGIDNAVVYDTVIVATVDGKDYLYDLTGKRISDNAFNIEGFSKGYGTFLDEEYKWGILDDKGNVLMSAVNEPFGTSTHYTSYSDGLFIVGENGKLGIVKTK